MADDSSIPLLATLEGVVQAGDKLGLLEVLSGEEHRTEASSLLRHPQYGPQLLCEACRLGHEDIVTLLTAHCPNVDGFTKQVQNISI